MNQKTRIAVPLPEESLVSSSNLEKIKGIRLEYEGRQFKIAFLREGFIILEAGADEHITWIVKETAAGLIVEPHRTIEKPRKLHLYPGWRIRIPSRVRRRVSKIIRKLLRRSTKLIRTIELEELRNCTVKLFVRLDVGVEVSFKVKKRDLYLGDIKSDLPLEFVYIQGPVPLDRIGGAENGVGVVDCGSDTDNLVVKLGGKLAIIYLKSFLHACEKIVEGLRGCRERVERRRRAKNVG